jgi:hypothetical protein
MEREKENLLTEGAGKDPAAQAEGESGWGLTVIKPSGA